MRRAGRPAGVACVLLLAFHAAVVAQTAPGGPGELPTWTSASKEGIGTALSERSKVWFTLHGGILTEVYYPRVDQADTRGLEFAVSDGARVWIESRDLRHAVERADDRALVYRQVSSEPAGRFRIVKTYVTDPDRDALLIDVTFTGPARYALYVLYRPAMKNSGYGNTGWSERGALLAGRADAASALVASGGFSAVSNGFAGVNDGYTDLLLHRRLTWSYLRADSGNIVQVARVARPARFTLALGFGATAEAALGEARASLARGFVAAREAYARGWSAYLAGLRKVGPAYQRQFDLAAMVVRAHEDKTHPGAIIASLSIPWGYSVPADSANVGGYHLVWSRDLYQAVTGLMLAGDSATARRSLRYLFEIQQRPDGGFPQNSWLDGRPQWPGVQLDEAAFPIVLAWQLGAADSATWRQHIRPAAEFIVAQGPATPQERWEEESGYSPSTIAAEIAGLVCAADIARAHGAAADADRYLGTADDWAAHLEPWLVTTTGHLRPGGAARGYYLRIDDDRDPNDGQPLELNNGAGTFDERDVVDQGFLELVRLGIRPALDTTIAHSLEVVDSTIRVETPRGPAFYRYNHDGYGETVHRGPWQGRGIGRLWTVLAGERGEYEVARGADPAPYLRALLRFANEGGMIPEQVWDRADPSQAGFRFGEGTGSATPLVWSMAQFLRLVVDAEAHRIVEQPAVVAEHFLHPAGR